MSKYIDAGKLIAGIKIIQQVLEHRDVRFNQVKKIRTECMTEFCKCLYNVINSLQQEQENVAERFAKIVRGNLIGIDKEVQQKFEQLYFEVTGNKMYGGYND